MQYPNLHYHLHKLIQKNDTDVEALSKEFTDLSTYENLKAFLGQAVSLSSKTQIYQRMKIQK
jgi:hypothetical protein